MKRLSSILIICVILFNTCGYFVWYGFSRYTVRLEMARKIKAGLDEGELTLIIVPNNETFMIEWTKANKEFKHNGEMYDVVKVENNGLQSLYYCVRDIKEKNLITYYRKILNTKKEPDKKLQKIFNLHYYNDQKSNIKPEFTTDITYTIYLPGLLSNTRETPYPPPKSI